MKKVSMFLPTLNSIASIAVSASKDDVTPIITQIALTREGDSLRAMATDRYMVATGRYSEVKFTDWAEGETVLVDPKGLKTATQMGRAVPKAQQPYTSVDISQDESESIWTSVEDSRIQSSVPTIKGTFPPVMKLFKRGEEASGVGQLNLRADFLARLSKLVTPQAKPKRDATWQFRFFASEGKTPAPVHAVYSEDETWELEALIQPALTRN